MSFLEGLPSNEASMSHSFSSGNDAAEIQRTHDIINWKPGETPPEKTRALGVTLTDTTTAELPPAPKTKKISTPPDLKIINNDIVTTVPQGTEEDDLQPYIDFVKGGPNPELQPARHSTDTSEQPSTHFMTKALDWALSPFRNTTDSNGH